MCSTRLGIDSGMSNISYFNQMTEAQSPSKGERFKAPETALVIFFIIVLAGLLTWFIPAGEFETTQIEVPGVGAREVVVPGSYQQIENDETAIWPRVRHTVGMILMAPILGFIDEDASSIIAFVLLVGGAFAVLQKTGAVDAALRRLVHASQKSKTFEALLIPMFMTLFSLGGAVFGMSEETIPFVLIFVPLALALGYDSIVGMAIPFVGASAGFAAAFLNPFTIGVAQGIADVPLFSGIAFRIVLWVVTTSVTTGFVMWYARRIRNAPALSPVNEIDQQKRRDGDGLDSGDLTFTSRQRIVLALFFLGMGLLVFGVLVFKWYILEIAALFVALGLGMGLAGGLGGNGTARAFMDGARDLVATALIIGLARGILVVLQDGQVIDTILFAVSTALEGMGATVAASMMFVAQTAINFFVPSGSGQAALTMPLMAPLADLLGVSRQIAVLAYQMGDGFTNLIIPTAPVLMGALSLAGVPWTKWARWMLPLQIVLFVLGLLTLTIAVQLQFGA